MPLLSPPLRHYHPTLCSSRSPNPNPNPNPNRRPSSSSSSAHPPLLLRFRTSRRQNIQYLKSLGIDVASSSTPETLDWTLAIVSYLKSKGFSDSHFPRLSFLCPVIFSSAADVDRTLAPVFAFLTAELSASPEQARDLILRCPQLLAASVVHRLRPTLLFLRRLGVRNLASPTSLHAHLLHSPIDRLVSKVRFLEDHLGLSREEAAGVCARFPAVFGYSAENNLRPKVEYLVYEMRRPVEEVERFPQYFGFSLEKRIAPRHLHLKERNVRIPLPRMLLWSDSRFYSKWK